MTKFERRPAGINDIGYEYGIEAFGIAPLRNKVRDRKGPLVTRDDISSSELEAGISIRAFGSENVR